MLILFCRRAGFPVESGLSGEEDTQASDNVRIYTEPTGGRINDNPASRLVKQERKSSGAGEEEEEQEWKPGNEDNDDEEEVEIKIVEGRGKTRWDEELELEVDEEEENTNVDCYQCVVCDKAYKQRDHLKTHVWRHVNAVVATPLHQTRKYNRSWAETNWWKCRLCPDSTPQICGLNSMVEHNKKVHGMPTGFVCPVCDKRDFRTKGLLRAHVMTHCEDKRPCAHCGKLFADGQKMKRHVNEVHAKVRNHMCNTCGKTFARKDKLRAHEVMHEEGAVKAGKDEDDDTAGERPFLCHKCGKGFAKQEHVNRHQKACGIAGRRRRKLLADDQERPGGYELGPELYHKDPETGLYNCKECNHKVRVIKEGIFEQLPKLSFLSQFKNKHYIAEHYARNHRKENLKLPFRCEECGKGYKVIKDLIRHQNRKNVHNEK